MVPALLLTVLSAEPTFSPDGTVDGITIEKRDVPGSPFSEFRLTVTTPVSVTALCDELYGDGSYDPSEPDLKSRRVLLEDAGVRIVHDEIAPAIVSRRDYVIERTVQRSPTDCLVRYHAIEHPAAPPRADVVRITKLTGSYHFETLPSGQTRATSVTFSDPAGSVPAFLVRGPQRDVAIAWMKRLLTRAARSKR